MVEIRVERRATEEINILGSHKSFLITNNPSLNNFRRLRAKTRFSVLCVFLFATFFLFNESIS